MILILKNISQVERENETPTNENCCLSVNGNKEPEVTFDTKYFLKSHHILSLIMFAIKDALLVQCESDLQMLGANKMPPF